jgi:predicted HicB family RNase H-like nuclease
MPRGEPKVMFAVRLPGPLREALRERAQEDGVSETELVEEYIERGLEADGRSRMAS